MLLLKETADFANDTIFFMQKQADNNPLNLRLPFYANYGWLCSKRLKTFFLELFYDNYCNFILN